MCRRAAWRRFSSEPVEIGESDLDERPHGLLEARCPRDLQRPLVRLARLRRVDPLLQPVVARDQQLLDLLARRIGSPLHISSVTRQSACQGSRKVSAAELLPDRIRVLIADDHRLFAEALEAILGGDERIAVVGHANDGSEAVELATQLRPDVTLMDIDMPVMDGFEATRKIRHSHASACILMLTGSNSREDVDRARRAGAAGYVTKDRIAAELIDAIVEVASR